MARTLLKTFGATGIALALAGCGAMDVPIPSFPQNRAGTEARAPANTIIAPTSQPRLAPEDIPAVDELIGISEDETEDLFGAPSLRRVDRDAQIWQYQTAACVLFLFFYPDEDGEARVSYVTSSGAHTGEASPGDQACVEAVARAALPAGGETS